MKDSILQRLAGWAEQDDHKNRLAVADAKESVTYGQFWELIRRTSSLLREAGVQPGSCIVCQCTQDIAYMTCYFASHLIGAVFVPVERGASADRISEIITDTDAALYLGLSEMPGAAFLDIRTLLDRAAECEPLSGYGFPEMETLSEILFSTGTTGKSKGIMLSFAADLAIAENVTQGVAMKPDNVELIPMPLSHSHGLRRTLANLYNGSSVCLLNGVILIKKFFDMIERYHVTSIDMAPTILQMVFKLSKDKIGEYRDQIDYIQLGSAPLVQEDKDRLAALLPKTRLYDFYGTTEAGCSCILDFNEVKHRAGCIGKPAVNARFLFVDENRNPIQATAENPGYMATAGGQNMMGYFKAPELTESVMKDGYIYTNDYAYMDDEGLIYYIGRKDDVINCGGIKISPDEIEAEVCKFSQVADCACVPMADPIQGQVPKLFVTLPDGVDALDEKALRAFLKEHLDANKLPKTIEVIGEIPRTYNGKVQRKKLL